MIYPPSVQKLIELFSEFPTVGPRTAARFVFHLIRLPEEKIEEFLSSTANLKKAIKICPFCFNLFEPPVTSVLKTIKDQDWKGFCQTCSSPSRNKTLLCIIEKEIDLLSIEKTKKYNGLYFILGGTLSLLKKIDAKKLKTKELTERLKTHPEIKEIIIALNPTTQGQTTALYLERLFKPFNKKITRLGRGLPMGAELEYADEETLSSAIERRK